MAEPQHAPGSRVQERRSCRLGTVAAVIADSGRLLVRMDDNGLVEQGGRTRWEAEPDEYVVETAPLAGILTEFVTGWRRDRPMRGSGFRTPDPSAVEPFPALAFLESETGLSREQLRRAQHPDDHPLTELAVADALVASIGSPTMFHDGTFTVQPNPRRDCCGGST